MTLIKDLPAQFLKKCLMYRLIKSAYQYQDRLKAFLRLSSRSLSRRYAVRPGHTFCSLLFFLFTFFIPLAEAATITITDVKNAEELNTQIQKLPPLKGKAENIKQYQMTVAVDKLLTYLAPTIKALPDYRNIFVANCTILFYTDIEKIKCDIEFSPKEVPGDVDPGFLILRDNLDDLRRNHIWVTRTLVNWAGTSTCQSGASDLYYIQPWDYTQSEEETPSQTSSPSNTTEPSKTQDVSMTNTNANTHSSTHSASLSSGSASITQSASITEPVPNWQASSPPLTQSIYADATTQANRYKEPQGAVGVVVDTLTNLQWQKTPSSTTKLWSEASSYCTSQRTGGYDDWRVPTMMELHSLVDYTIATEGPPKKSSLHTIFNPISDLSKGYWSSQLVKDYKDGSGNQYYWGVTNQGYDLWQIDTNKQYIRCVRSRKLEPIFRYKEETSGVITDYLTMLKWKKSVSTSGGPNGDGYYNWQQAQTACTGGWRLPTIKELETIVNYDIKPDSGTATMDQVAFSGEPEHWAWSSTVYASSPSSYAWDVGFHYGNVGYDGAQAFHLGRVRCVRLAQ